MGERLDKILSNRFNISRKQAKADIKAGLVKVSGRTVTEAEYKVLDGDDLSYKDRSLQHSKNRYIMLFKPAGVLTATRDSRAKTVIDLLSCELKEKGLFPVGRLDRDTTGLLLITNDGDWGHRLVSPKHHVKKVYSVTLDKPADDTVRAEFAVGVTLADGELCKPAELVFTDDPNTVTLTLREGKYHQIKRMFGVFGIGVNALHRERIGDLSLDPELKSGDARLLTSEEILLAEELK